MTVASKPLAVPAQSFKTDLSQASRMQQTPPINLDDSSSTRDFSRKTNQAVLRTEKLVKIYGGRSVVNGIDIHVNEGEVVGILGPNGAGKTTTFYLIVGLVRPNGGRVYFQDRDVTRFAMHRRGRMGVGGFPPEGMSF